MRRVMVLYRPVGEIELELIQRTGSLRFPTRLPEQPIFYPVVTPEYAAQLAREWNARDGGRGYVTRFAVDAVYIDRFEPQQVGARIHTEYWIPADELDEFNVNIVGTIEVIASFSSDD
ncbi:MAG TPA: hypothetical protein VEV38_02070 [Candidatus Eremiobacteraceae bacterium]|nr:hypothetical protein [Candidatus Eremiobacteraceae bacterium]